MRRSPYFGWRKYGSARGDLSIRRTGPSQPRFAVGLAIVQAVMTRHGGSIRLVPSDTGVAFELEFPVA